MFVYTQFPRCRNATRISWCGHTSDKIPSFISSLLVPGFIKIRSRFLELQRVERASRDSGSDTNLPHLGLPMVTHVLQRRPVHDAEADDEYVSWWVRQRSYWSVLVLPRRVPQRQIYLRPLNPSTTNVLSMDGTIAVRLANHFYLSLWLLIVHFYGCLGVLDFASWLSSLDQLLDQCLYHPHSSKSCAFWLFFRHERYCYQLTIEVHV